jgi:non-reducing end alpha-L-arabinofuranosidase
MVKNKKLFLIILSLAFILPVAMMMMAMSSGVGDRIPQRPEGPCDIYAAGGSPCVAAHSTTRALYASYNGPLYQVMRQVDGKTLDIGVTKPKEGDPGGYADAAAQDAFCANTTCWITTLYDQSGKGNHLTQAPRGAFLGPAMGGFNNIPIADMAPISIMGHKAYGIFIAPGMGLRLNDAKGTAVDDQAEGQYWVINGHHYNDGCCYDYGNAETDSRDDGDGTMETTYYGNSASWYHGLGKGPWVMTDQENNLVGCVNPDPNDKSCPELPIINWRFVTAMADGEPHHWRSMGGDAQGGDLRVMYDGGRIKNDRNSYDPMRKQGAILLGNGGDNSNSSQGTFYEGAMTAAGTFPTKETNMKIQANVVAARYDVQAVSLAPANATNTPRGLQTFALQSSQNTTVTFKNTTGVPATGVTLSVIVPNGWKAVALNSQATSKKIAEAVPPGGSVSATFNVTSSPAAFNGNLIGKASWMANNKPRSETITEKVRNVSLVKINEFRIGDGSDNTTNSFVELYNAGNIAVDISNWTFNEHPTQMPIFSSVKIPAGTKISAHGFYLLGLSTSGLAVPTKKGESTIFVRSTTGMSAGDVVKIGSGATAETRTITSMATPEPEPAPATPGFGGGRPPAPAGSTVIWQPLPEGPVITIPAGSKNIPVVSVSGFKVGQKMAIGYGATYPSVAKTIEKYEVVTITKVDKPGTQAWLATDAKAGSTNIKVSSVANISVGDKIRLDIDSKGHGIETVTVTKVGTASSRGPGRGPFAATEDVGTGLELAAPLKFDHSHNIPFSVNGTGISFEPATSFKHSSNEPVLALAASITLDRPLANNQEINAVVLDEKVKTAGYQGEKAPNQWFGGPALLASAGSMSLRDANGNVVDGLNYGGIVDPWLAEGYQATSGAGEGGNFVVSPGFNPFRGGFGQGAPVVRPNRSAGRFPDGYDSDDNRKDFQVQYALTLATPSEAGSTNIKVGNVANLSVGQKIIIGSAQQRETVSIAAIGTPGGTTISAASTGGATIVAVPIGTTEGFSAGQTVTVGNGAERETATIAAIIAPRRRFFGGGANANRTVPTDTLTFTAPLKNSHAAGAQVSGTGITLSTPLSMPHEGGAPLASDIPTPGEPNRYTRKS